MSVGARNGHPELQLGADPDDELGDDGCGDDVLLGRPAHSHRSDGRAAGSVVHGHHGAFRLRDSRRLLHPHGYPIDNAYDAAHAVVTDEADEASRVDLGRVFEVLTAVIAPITVLSALLAYIGSVRNRAYYSYLGVDQNLLQLSIEDLVLRSADVAFGAVARLVAACAALVVLDRVLVVVQRRFGEPRRLDAALAVAGTTLALVGLLHAVGVQTVTGSSPILGPILLGLGSVIAFRFGRRALPGTANPLATSALVTLLVLALFWAATLYAQDLGRRAAAAVDDGRSPLPVVIVYSDTYLDLPGSHVTASEETTPAGEKVYRYAGLFLLTYANDRWLLVSHQRSDGYRSRVAVLRDTEAVRVEVAAPTG